MNSTQILTAGEVQTVLADLRRRAKRSVNSQQNLAIFRLSCCCGLRVMEICGLSLADIVVDGARPAVHVRKDITKGREGRRRGRLVPVWWDRGTLEDLTQWVAFRRGQGASGSDPVVCGQSAGVRGERLTTDLVAKRWRTSLRVLGEARVRQLSIHSGRHSFCSHAIRVGRSLVEVRDAAGHRNIATTGIYLHTVDRDGIGDLFSIPTTSEDLSDD